MYTWGYLKENILSKLNIDEKQANELNYLSRFPYYANEAMTQICAIKPNCKYYDIIVTDEMLGIEQSMPEDFIAFSDDVVYLDNEEVHDDIFVYSGYNGFICIEAGTYHIPYKARWFFFTKDLQNANVITAPADVCDTIPSYVTSQCYKIDDETKSAVYRNEYEMFLSRLDNTTFKRQRTVYIGGNW